MTISAHTITATLHVTGEDPIDLDPSSGSVTLDEGWAPYAKATAVIPLPEQATLDLIDPRITPAPRITIVAAADYGTGTEWNASPPPSTTRTYDLVLLDRTIDHNAATVTMSLASDEAVLQGYALVDDEPDDTALAYQSSVRSIIDNVVLSKIGASLEAGDTDADFTTLTALTNLIPNPSAVVDLNGTTSLNLSSLVRQTSFTHGLLGTAFRLNGNASTNNTWFTIGGDETGMRLAMQPGHTYTVSGNFWIDTPLTGSANGMARRIVVIISQSDGVAYTFAQSAQAPNVAGGVRLSLTFTLPEDTKTVSIRWYHGYASATVAYWHDLMLLEGDGTDTDKVALVPFFTGSTTDTDLYNYTWTGVADASTSQRTPVYERPPETLIWQPGESGYDFIEPILQQSALRLFCDELRVWRLVDDTYSVGGRVTVAEGYNAFRGSDTISRTASASDGSPLFFDAVVIKYTWNDTENVQQVRYDVASVDSPSQAYLKEVSRPFPGPGAAAYILGRVAGQGRTLSLTARMDFSTTPGMEVVATLPGTPIQTGYTSSVTWDFDADEMTVGSRGLIDTPASAWVFLPAGESWVDSPTGASWIGEVV